MARVLGLLVLAFAMEGQPRQPFDLVVSGWEGDACVLIPGAWVSTALEWRNPDRTDRPSRVLAIDSADHQTIFGVLMTADMRIVRIGPDGSRHPFFTGPLSGGDAKIAVAPSGRVFVLRGSRLDVINPAGVLEATYNLPRARYAWEYDFVSAASDGCTVYYGATGGAVARFNGCTGQPLSDFATPADPADLFTYARELSSAEPCADGDVGAATVIR